MQAGELLDGTEQNQWLTKTPKERTLNWSKLLRTITWLSLQSESRMATKEIQ
jgi:hypothetical protein